MVNNEVHYVGTAVFPIWIIALALLEMTIVFQCVVCAMKNLTKVLIIIIEECRLRKHDLYYCSTQKYNTFNFIQV